MKRKKSYIYLKILSNIDFMAGFAYGAKREGELQYCKTIMVIIANMQSFIEDPPCLTRLMVDSIVSSSATGWWDESPATWPWRNDSSCFGKGPAEYRFVPDPASSVWGFEGFPKKTVGHGAEGYRVHPAGAPFGSPRLYRPPMRIR